MYEVRTLTCYLAVRFLTQLVMIQSRVESTILLDAIILRQGTDYEQLVLPLKLSSAQVEHSVFHLLTANIYIRK